MQEDCLNLRENRLLLQDLPYDATTLNQNWPVSKMVLKVLNNEGFTILPFW